MAPPTYENDLVLLTTEIAHSSQVRSAFVTYAINDNTLNASAQAYADVFQGKFVDAWAATISDECTIVGTKALKGDGTATFTVGESTAAPSACGNNTQALPSNCALLIKKRTALGGRVNRGRLYMPWILTEGEVDELGVISSTDIDSYQLTADAWLSDMEDGGDQEVVIANRHYNLPWDNPNRRLTSVTIGAHVTSLLVESVVATQRRRMSR